MSSDSEDLSKTYQSNSSRNATGDAQPSEPAGTQSLVGMRLGEYQVTQVLGEGGMGFVYRGLQPMIGKQVAIKVLRNELARDPAQVQRLLAEARAVNAIRHRGIIDIFSFGELPDGRQYLVMELLDGIPLDKWMAEKGPLSFQDVTFVVDEVLDALGAAHRVGVIHRDLKPSNTFLVSPPHSARYIKLLDFGLAKQAELPHGSTPQTHATSLIGTPAYMAPEQARGEAVGPATDLYALGAMIFDMLTGRPPFVGTSPFEVIARHLNDPVPRPSTYRQDTPPALDELVFELLEKDPQKRPSRADEIRERIQAIRSQLGGQSRIKSTANLSGALQPIPLREVVVPAPKIETAPRQPSIEASQPLVVSRRSPVPWIAGAAVVMVVGAVAIAWLGRTPPAPPVVTPVPLPALPIPAPVAEKPAEPPPKAPALGHLALKSNTPCELTVDGKPAVKGEAAVAPGKHELACKNAFGAVGHASVDVAPGATVEVPLNFGYGTLEVWVLPFATVSIDGRSFGDTPISPVQLVEGSHRVDLRMEDKHVTRHVTLRPGQYEKLKVNMDAQ